MITPAQSRAGRALLDWSQDQLAQAAHVGLSTVRDFERGRRVPGHNNLLGLKTALEDAGVIFVAENGEGPGVRLRKGVVPTLAEPSSPEQRQAGVDHARHKAGKAADRALTDVDASDDEKAARRGALTDEPAIVAKARGKHRSKTK